MVFIFPDGTLVDTLTPDGMFEGSWSFKNCVLQSKYLTINPDIENYNVYGSTLSAKITTIVVTDPDNTYTFKDNYFDMLTYADDGTNSVSVAGGGTLNLLFNRMNVNAFYINGVTTPEYAQPIYDSTYLSLPLLTVYQDIYDQYSDSDTMYYANYGLPYDVNPTLTTLRSTNDIDTDAYEYTREAQGGFSNYIDPDLDLSTSGHVGAFYFGGDFTNGEPTVFVPTITISAMGGAQVDATVGNDKPTITISTMPQASAYSQDFFHFDFSGVPLNGGSPLNVEFTAYNYEHPRGMYANYEATEFRWWFEYNEFSGADEYISCATDIAEHAYCGGYLEEFDVRLCIMYSPRD